MKIKTNTAFIWTWVLPLALVNTQRLSDSLNKFSIDLLKETVNEGGESLNIALSTYTVWALLTLVSEGAKGNSLQQLESSLALPSDRNFLRDDYKNLTNILTTRTDGVSLNVATGVFVDKDYEIKKSFEDIAKYIYSAKINSINFGDPQFAVDTINHYVADATKNRIQRFVNTDDVLYAQLFIISTFFFKGEWTLPFDPKDTRNETFFGEKSNKLGDVKMMFKSGQFPYARFEDIRSHVIELPYGTDKKMSMIIILPFKDETLSEVLNILSKRSFSTIMRVLQDSEQMFFDENILVHLPQFKIISDFNLNVVLNKMGIKDIFSSAKANLLDMVNAQQSVYLARLIQRAEILVDEKGTVAYAATGASFPNKSTPPRFRANRPFLYFIVNKISNSILFAGKVSNPKTLKI